MREKDVSRLLTDEYAERILVATQSTSRSVQEISDKYDIPIAACYRKIHELEEAGFLNVAQIVTTPKGKTMKLYRSLLKSAQLVYQEGIFKVYQLGRLQEGPVQFHRLPDRKSTRLNSSHLGISYAVFCLKKKKRK